MDSLIGNFQIFELNSDWTIYEEQLEMLFLAASVQESDKVPVLLAVIGSSSYQLLRGLCSPDLPQSKSFVDLCNLMKNQTVQNGTKTVLSVDISSKEVIGDQESSTVVQECYQVSDFNGNKYEHFETSGHHGHNNSGQLNGSNNVRPSHQEHQCDVCDSTEHVRVNCKFKESVLCHQCNGKEHEQGFCHLSSAERFQDQHESTVYFEGNQAHCCESTFEQEQFFKVQVGSSSMNIGHQPRSKNFKDQGTIFSRNSGHCNIRIKGHLSMNKSVHLSRVVKIVQDHKVGQFNPIYGERKVKWSRREKRYRNGHASRKGFKSSFSTERIEHGHPGGNRIVFHQGQVFSATKESTSCSFKTRGRPGYHKDYGRF